MKYYAATEAANNLGCDVSALGYAFRDAGRETTTESIKGVRITRHHIDNVDAGVPGVRKWVYSLPDNEQSDEEPSPEGEETHPLEPGNPELKERWEELVDKLEEAHDTLGEIGRAVQDRSVLQDDEMWDYLSQERKQANKKIEKLVPELGRVAFKARRSLSWHTEDGDAGQEDVAGDEDDDAEPAPENVEDFDPFEGIVTSNDINRDEDAVLIYGGTPNHEYRDRLMADFGWDIVMWVDGHRRVTCETERVKNGKYELVICLTDLATHTLAGNLREACKESGTPIATVEKGHGISSIKRAVNQAIEEGDYVPHGAGSSDRAVS